MNMNDKIQFIREKCIAANPEIVELKCGCEASDRYGNDWVYNGWEWWGKEKLMKNIGTELAIVGRPIRLADVLLAIHGRYHHGDVVDVRILPSGTFQKMYTGTVMPGDWDYGPVWNLRADDLEKQSEETINFLAELLT